MQIAKRKIYDVCIIGSGAAGGFMAKELTAAGADTILLEAGDRARLEDLYIHDWPYDLPRRGFGLFKQATLTIAALAVRSARHIAERRRRGEL